ncbi:hypothetical protein [Streptomyces sp. NPDC058664]|uniref:hypothetical protein n=1 Tax=unclassified Streptomyces TaxID=2593676 RepID=UPI003651C0B4
MKFTMKNRSNPRKWSVKAVAAVSLLAGTTLAFGTGTASAYDFPVEKPYSSTVYVKPDAVFNQGWFCPLGSTLVGTGKLTPGSGVITRNYSFEPAYGERGPGFSVDVINTSKTEASNIKGDYTCSVPSILVTKTVNLLGSKLGPSQPTSLSENVVCPAGKPEVIEGYITKDFGVTATREYFTLVDIADRTAQDYGIFHLENANRLGATYDLAVRCSA